MNEIRLIPVHGLPEITAGDDLPRLLADACSPVDGDVIVIAQKVVSKAEDRIVEASDRATIAREEAVRILRKRGDMIIAETHHGFVCANAGVDASNVEPGRLVLLPVDPDASARRIRARLKHLRQVDVGIVISDTFGRPWRNGQTNVAIGVAGFDPFLDHRGATDAHGNELSATHICIADEIAGAAELVMGKADGICAVVVRGVRTSPGRGSAREIVRSYGDDLFR